MAFNIDTTCCFTGHRIISKSDWLTIENKTEKAIEGLIEKGYKTFITGGALGFDTMVAICVLRLRRAHNIRLVIAVPCKEQSKSWNEKDKNIYENILKEADEVRVLSESYTRDCMHRRNRFMVDNSSICIAYLKKMTGGTAYTVNYAVENDKEVIFIR